MSFTTALLPKTHVRLGISIVAFLLALGMLTENTLAAEQSQPVKQSVVRFNKLPNKPKASTNIQKPEPSDSSLRFSRQLSKVESASLVQASTVNTLASTLVHNAGRKRVPTVTIEANKQSSLRVPPPLRQAVATFPLEAKPLVPLKKKTNGTIASEHSALPQRTATIRFASHWNQNDAKDSQAEEETEEQDGAAEIVSRPSNSCCVPGIDNEVASDRTLMNRSWLGISPVFSTEDKDYRDRSMPPNIAASKFGSLDKASHIGNGCARYNTSTEFTWAAPSFYHQPLYFEQPMLERYGHFHHDEKWESVLSTAHFFSTTLILPYKMGAQPLCERSYTLGRYRPGNCNPVCRELLPHSIRGFLYQGLATGGFVLLFP